MVEQASEGTAGARGSAGAGGRGRRILLVRTSALGDIVHALPALTALREAEPAARIAWAVDAAFAPLLTGHPDLDQVIALPLRAVRRTGARLAGARELVAAVLALRRFRPQLVLDLMGNHKAGVLAWLSGAPLRRGHAANSRREPSSAVWINDPAACTAQHAVERTLAVLPPESRACWSGDLGGRRLPCLADAHGAALLASVAAPPVLLQPGAGWGNKQLPVGHWAAVAGLIADLGPVRVLTARGEEHLGAAVAAASGDLAEVWHAPTLPTLATLLAGARLVLGGDTGPIHLAHALGVPVLAVHGPTDPAHHGPWDAPDAALSLRLPCSYCHRRFEEAKACLLQLAPARIAHAARLRLAASESSAPPS